MHLSSRRLHAHLGVYTAPCLDQAPVTGSIALALCLQGIPASVGQ